MARERLCRPAGRRVSAASQHGVSAVLVALLAVALCACVALVINVGHLFSVRGELQNAADAAAVAGAWELNGTADKLDAAQTKASQYAGYHATDTSIAVSVPAASVELGRWTGPSDTSITCDQRGATSPDGYRFCAVSKSDANAGWATNAVRVVAARSGTPGTAGGGEVPIFMDGILRPGAATQAVRAEAIAVTGGPCSHGCPGVPFAVQVGCVTKAGSLQQLECNKLFWVGFSDDTHNTAGWSSLSQLPASATTVCDVTRHVATCNAAMCRSINLTNGNLGSSQCGDNQVVDETKQDLCLWFKEYAGKKIQVPIVAPGLTTAQCLAGVQPTPGVCQQYNGDAVITGWGTFLVSKVWCKDVDGTGNNKTDPPVGCPGPGNDANGSTGQGVTMCIEAQFLCNQVDDDPAQQVGCGWYGTTAQSPKGVR